jgi:hypothetical protein
MDFKELDEYFNENEEPRREIFNILTTSEELHHIAENHNWDNGITVLEWIVESTLCGEATALMIFWMAQPNDYVKYNFNENSIKYVDMDIFNLIKTIMKNYVKGFYKKTSIKYNPKDDIWEENIPDIMYEETTGEEPYIYYDEKESFSLFGDYLESLLVRCDNSMELYNIVYLLVPMELSKTYDKIFEHKHCDKGIALFIYWRMKNYWNFEGEMEQKIINRIKNHEYNEIIKYNPKDDIENKKCQKNKWEIPEIMKMEIK